MSDKTTVRLDYCQTVRRTIQPTGVTEKSEPVPQSQCCTEGESRPETGRLNISKPGRWSSLSEWRTRQLDRLDNSQRVRRTVVWCGESPQWLVIGKGRQRYTSKKIQPLQDRDISKCIAMCLKDDLEGVILVLTEWEWSLLHWLQRFAESFDPEFAQGKGMI